MADQDGPQAGEQPGGDGQPGGQGGESDESGDVAGDVSPVGRPVTLRAGGFVEDWEMPPAPWWRRPRVAAVVGTGLVVVVVAGLLTWGGGGGPGGDRAAFDEALDRLAAAPVVRYASDPGGEGTAWELTVTADGSGLGAVAVAGARFDALTVSGRTYVRAIQGPFTALGLDVPAGVPPDRWVTGGALGGTALAAAMSPGSLAGALREALERAADLSGDGLADEVGGRPALGVSTPRGDLYVSRERPHQVLRFVPRPAGQGTSTSDSDSGGDDGGPGGLAGLGDVAIGVVPAGDRSTLDDLTDLYDRLAAAAGQLQSAVDADVRLTVQGAPTVSCFGGCVVTATVGGTPTGPAPGDPGTPGAPVTAEMLATVSVDGAPVGSCASPPTPVPATGTGPLSCASPEAGARAGEALAQKQAESGAFAGFVTVNVTASADVVARAMDTAQVAELTQSLAAGRARALADACAGGHVGSDTDAGSGQVAGQSGTRATDTTGPTTSTGPVAPTGPTTPGGPMTTTGPAAPNGAGPPTSTGPSVPATTAAAGAGTAGATTPSTLAGAGGDPCG